MLRKLTISLLFLLFTVNAFADTATNQLTAILQNVQTMQANFTQRIQDNHGNILQQSSGKMAMQRPGLFRWETTKPNSQLIVADGNTIWIYDKDLQQITKQKQNTSSNTPGLLLSDSVDHLAKRYIIRDLTTTNSSQAFKLLPANRDLFKSVELYFSNDGKLQQMTLYDNLGQITQIQFNGVTINNNLSDNLFHFTPPSGVDVVSG